VKKRTVSDGADISEYAHDDKPRPYLCTVCHKRFTTKRWLTIHSMRHDGENLRYSCNYCGKRFTDQNNLKKHMNLHSSNTSALNVEDAVKAIEH